MHILNKNQVLIHTQKDIALPLSCSSRPQILLHYEQKRAFTLMHVSFNRNSITIYFFRRTAHTATPPTHKHGCLSFASQRMYMYSMHVCISVTWSNVLYAHLPLLVTQHSMGCVPLGTQVDRLSRGSTCPSCADMHL